MPQIQNANEWRKLISALKKAGWSVERNGKSKLRVKPPSGAGVVVLPHTPGDWRSMKNYMARLRRLGWEG